MNNNYKIVYEESSNIIYLKKDDKVLYCRFNSGNLIMRNDKDNTLLNEKDFFSEVSQKDIPSDIVLEFMKKTEKEKKGNILNKWERRFLEMAHLISTWSKDPSTQVGAVIVDKNRRIVSTGYNGFAIGVEDTEDRLNDRSKKYPLTLHAEENALSFAKQDLTNCTLYVYGLPPCAHCASLIIQSGIKKVIACKSTDNDRWKESFELTNQIFNEAKVDLIIVE